MNFWNEHGTKILGGVTAVLGTLASLITAGSFDKLLTETAIGWMSIFVALATAAVGGATMARGFNNSAQVKIATAMETAIKAQPPTQGGFARPLMLALMLAVAVPVALSLHGCASLGLAPASSFSDRLAYAQAQTTGLRDASTRALDAKLISSEDMQYCITVADRSSDLLRLARVSHGQGDLSTAEGRLVLVSGILTEPPGAFCIETLTNGQRVMWHKLPDGNSGLLRLRPVVAGGDQHPSWEWDGNEDRPTLTPSVHLPGRWHGWFRAGRMVSC